MQDVLVRWLKDAGYAVTSCTLHAIGGPRPAALAPRLVITDVPNLQAGIAIVEAVRHAFSSPILVVSARFRRGLRASSDVARRLGVSAVLPKPFTREELLEAVCQAIA
ncbi:MAG: response regulator [Betaproteobacteria bacterium]|nr:response regulator [Betaproteobacteria bacterium]